MYSLQYWIILVNAKWDGHHGILINSDDEHLFPHGIAYNTVLTPFSKGGVFSGTLARVNMTKN